MEFAVEFFGADHVMYGSDYPCWSPADALRFFAECGFSEEVQAEDLRRQRGTDLGHRRPGTARTRPVLTAQYAASAARILDTASSAGAQYADVQFWTIRQEDVAVRNGDVRDASDVSSAGYACARSIDGSWGFFGSDRFDDAAFD